MIERHTVKFGPAMSQKELEAFRVDHGGFRTLKARCP
jgi:hypothetical protein